jgi:hypothetical protein
MWKSCSCESRDSNLRSQYVALWASMTEAAMSRWTDEELRELATLWPKLSVSEIVKRMHRPRWAIRSKAKRLRLDGMRPHNPSDDVEAVNPPKRRWGWRTARAEADGRK